VARNGEMHVQCISSERQNRELTKTKRSKKEMTKLNRTVGLKKRMNQIETTRKITETMIMNER